MDRSIRPGTQAATMEGLITAIAVMVILYFGRSIFVPLALAVLLSFILHPATVVLRRLSFSRSMSVVTVIFLAVCAVVALAAVMTRELTELAESLPRYENTIKEKIQGLRSAGGVSSVFGRASQTLQHLSNEVAGSQNAQEGPARGADAPVPVEIRQPRLQFLDRYRSIIQGLTDPLSTAAIVLVFLIFIMLQREDLRDRIIRVVGPRNFQKSTAAMDEAGGRLSRYFLTQTIVNSVFGAFIGAGLAIIGVPNAVLFGALAALMRFVPFIGAYIAAAIPLLLAAAVAQDWTPFFWTLALYAAGETFVGQVIEPFLYGHTTGLSPFAVIVAASFWTWLWGPIGLVMSTPLTVCFVVMARHVEKFEFLFILLTDTPALTSQQSFYQRVLAGNEIEAVHDAEQYLKTHSLSQFYGDVAIPGLALAHQDWERGALDETQAAGVGRAVTELIEDLEDYDDAPPPKRPEEDSDDAGASPPACLPVLTPEQLPPGWQNKKVLVLGGRTEMDSAGAAILADLLKKHDIAAEVSETRGRAALRPEALAGTSAVCVSYFGSAGANAHIRLLSRRLLKLGPDARIIFCTWDAPESDAGSFGLSQPSASISFEPDLLSALTRILELAEFDSETKEEEAGRELDIAS